MYALQFLKTFVDMRNAYQKLIKSFKSQEMFVSSLVHVHFWSVDWKHDRRDA